MSKVNGRKLDIDQSIRILSRNPDIKVKNHEIFLIEKSQNLGNKTWGRLDFLKKVGGFSIWFVPNFSGI